MADQAEASNSKEKVNLRTPFPPRVESLSKEKISTLSF